MNFGGGRCKSYIGVKVVTVEEVELKHPLRWRLPV